jgi:hypothetical protein
LSVFGAFVVFDEAVELVEVDGVGLIFLVLCFGI